MGLCGSKTVLDHGRPTAYEENRTNITVSARKMSLPKNFLAQGHGEGVLDICALGPSRPTHFFSCGEDRKILLRDYGNGQIVGHWDLAHESAINRLTFMPTREVLASASRDKTIKLWSLTSPTPVGTLTGHDLTVSAISATSDGLKLASGSRDTTVRLWDVETQKLLFRGHKPQNLVTCLKWHTGNGEPQNIILEGAEDLRVRVWDTRIGIKEVQVMEGYVYFPLAMDVSPCGNYLLTSSKGFNGVGGEARLWDLRGVGAAGSGAAPKPDDFARTPAALIRQYNGHVQDATACCFLPRSIAIKGVTHEAFLTASKDGTIRLWERDTGAVLYEHVDPSYGSFTALTLLSDNEVPISNGSSHRVGSARSLGKQIIFAATTYSGSTFVFAINVDGSFTCVSRTPVGEAESSPAITYASPLPPAAIAV